MTSTFRPSDIYGQPGTTPRRRGSTDEPEPEARRIRWPVVAGIAALAVIALALAAGPSEIGEGGIPPAVVDVVSEDQAIAALALYRAEAEARDALAVQRSLFSPPGPSTVLRDARQSEAEVLKRLTEARSIPDADPAVRAYWSDPAHDEVLRALRGAVQAISEINLLAATHDSLYDGAGAIPLGSAQFELASLYLTGDADGASPLPGWGRALLAELDGVGSRAEAQGGRAAADGWWQDRAAALTPVAADALRAYLGGLPESTRVGLAGHPLAGPGLERLRTG